MVIYVKSKRLGKNRFKELDGFFTMFIRTPNQLLGFDVESLTSKSDPFTLLTKI